MPNLCRRGRKSPQSQNNILSLSSSNMNASSTNNNKSPNASNSSPSSNKKFLNLFTSSNINDFNRATDRTMENSQNRIAWYSYLINMFSGSSSNQINQTNNINQNQMTRSASNLGSKLNKNLLQDLDDENNINFTLKHGYGLDRDSKATTLTSDGALTSSTAAASTQATISRSASTAFNTNTYNLRSSKRTTDILNMNNANQNDVYVNQDNMNFQERHGDRRRSICCSPWLLLLLLLVFTGAGLFAFKSYDTTGLFHRLNQLHNKIQPEPIIEKIKEPIQNLNIEPIVENIKTSSNKILELIKYFQENYISPFINLNNFDELWQITYENLIHCFNILADYSIRLAHIIYEYSVHFLRYLFEKCNEFWLFLMKKKDEMSMTSKIDYKLSTSNINPENNQELIEQFNLIKENIIAETIFKNEKIKSADIEQLRIDLDQKFNYTLTLMSNKLADQSMQHEESKISQEKELQQIKDVLDKLQSDYKSLIGQIEEQQKLILSQQKLVQQQQQQQTTTTTVPVIQTPGQNANEVSFQKIEEIINRSFFLYNADRTGMTDFASESLGASILFTRCTENYLHNSRWFTFFNVPISRITVSPRVVIQVIL
jgi:hypothetical protein